MFNDNVSAIRVFCYGAVLFAIYMTMLVAVV